MRLIALSLFSVLAWGQALHITGAHTSPTYSVALVGSLPSSGCAIGEVAIVGPATATPSLYVNSTAGTCTWTALLSGSGTVTNSGTLTANAIVSGNGGVNITTPNTNATIDSSGNIVTPGTISGGTSGTAGSIKFYDSGGTNFTGWSAPTSLSGGCLLDIPAGDPAGQVLQFAAPSGGHCAGSWISASGGAVTTTMDLGIGGYNINGAGYYPSWNTASGGAQVNGLAYMQYGNSGSPYNTKAFFWPSNWDNTTPVNVLVAWYPQDGGGNVVFDASFACLAVNSSSVVFNTAAPTENLPSTGGLVYTTIPNVPTTGCVAGQLGVIKLLRDTTVSGNSSDTIDVLDVAIQWTSH